MVRATNRITSLFFWKFPRRRGVVLFLGLLVLLLAHGMAWLFRIQPAVSLWFPPSGVGIALTLWLGSIGVGLTWIASFIVAPLWGNTGWARFASITDAIEPLVAWVFFYSCFRGTLSLKKLPNAIAFLISAPLLACGTSAVLGTLALVGFNKMTLASLPGSIPQWWLGNAIGTMIIAPVVLLFTPQLNAWIQKQTAEPPEVGASTPVNRSTFQHLRHRWLEIGLVLGSTIFFSWLTVEATQVSISATLRLSFLSIIPVFWAVARFGVIGSVMTASFSVVFTLLVYLLVYPHAIDLPAFPVDPDLLYTHKLSLLLQSVIALLAGTAITERSAAEVALEVEKIKSAETAVRAQLSKELLQVNHLLHATNQRLQASEERFRTSIENMLDCFGVYTAIRNEQGQIVDFRVEYVNEAACISNQLTFEEQIGQGLCQILPGHYDSGLFEEYCQVVETGQPLIKDSLVYEDNYGQRCLVRAFDIRIAKLADGFVATWRDVTDRRLTEEELRRHKQELKTLVENSPDIIARLDRQLRHVYINPSIEAIIGVPAQAIIGKTHTELGLPEPLCHNWTAKLQTLFQTGQEQIEEFTFATPNRHLRYYEVRMVPEFATDGTVESALGITRDVTELKRVEYSLRQANEQFRLASEAVNSVIYDWDTCQNYIERTSGMDRVFGYTPEQIQPTSDWYFALIHPHDREAVIYQIQTAFATNDRYAIEYRVRHHRGHYLSVADQGLIIRNETGEVIRVVGSATDISERARLEAERQKIEAALKQSEEELRLALEAMPQIVWMADTAGTATYCNQRWYAYSGLSQTESLGFGSFRTVHSDDRRRLQEQWTQALSASKSFEVEIRIRRRDGIYRWFLCRAVPIHDPNGRLTSWIGTSTDIEDQKRIQEELRQSEERLALALRSAGAGMWQWFKADNRTIWSDDNFRLLGYEPGRVPSTYENWLNAVHSDDRAMVQQSVNQAIEAQRFLYFEYRVLLPDGTERWLADSGQLTYDTEGQPDGMIGIQVDITQRKLAEIALQQSQERLNLAMEAAGMGSWDWDIQTGQVYWSPNLERMFGMAPGSFDGRYETVAAMIHPDDRLWVEQAIDRAIYEHQDYNIEFRFIKSDGTVRWAVGRGQVFYNATGTPIRMTGIDLDISERKQIETERVRLLEREQAARQQAEAASRMKDEFLAIVSHELRSPLNGILGWSRLLRTRTLDPSTTEKALASIERNAQAQTQLIEDLLDISRIIRGTVRLNLRPVNLAPIIQASLDTVRPTAEAKLIQLQAHLEPAIGLVSGDSERLQQVIWNLLSNAVKFTDAGGRVDLQLNRIADQVRIQVKDTGKGISAEFLPHVFDRFRQADSTTTRTQGGLGLGLAIVRSLVELHGGTVWAESAGEGQGTTFTIELPLLLDGKQQTNVNFVSTLSGDFVSLEQVRVLIVDDEADTREFLQTALEQFGATVTVAASAAEAFALFQQSPPDILLSDIGMPEEDGYTLIQRIRALSPELGGQVPAAALTAYVRGDDRLEALKAGFQMHVPKPIEPLQLLHVISQLVASNLPS